MHANIALDADQIEEECTLVCTFHELHVQGQANCNIRCMEYNSSRCAEQYVGFDGVVSYTGAR